MTWTNRGAHLQAQYAFRGVSVPTNYYIALVTVADTPTVDTNVLGDLTEIATGNGYDEGGYQLTPDGTDFDTSTENDTLDREETQIKDIVWTASGGTIPSSGAGAAYAVLTTDEATVADRQVIMWWDLGGATITADGQAFTLSNLEFRATTA